LRMEELRERADGTGTQQRPDFTPARTGGSGRAPRSKRPGWLTALLVVSPSLTSGERMVREAEPLLGGEHLVGAASASRPCSRPRVSMGSAARTATAGSAAHRTLDGGRRVSESACSDLERVGDGLKREAWAPKVERIPALENGRDRVGMTGRTLRKIARAAARVRWSIRSPGHVSTGAECAPRRLRTGSGRW